MTDKNEWEGYVKQYHALGLWHATRYLSTFTVIKDPYSSAQDVVQNAWAALWRRRVKFSKALFITSVLGYASNAVRDSRPIELGYARTKPRQSRITNSFPVQVFGRMIDEVTGRDEIKTPGCGDE